VPREQAHDRNCLNLEAKGVVVHIPAEPKAIRQFCIEQLMRVQADSTERLWANMCRHVSWGAAIIRANDDALLAVNPSFARMHKWKRDELIGTSFAETLAPEFRTSLSVHSRVADIKGHHSFESVHIRKDGTHFVVLTDLTSIKDLDGKATIRAATVLNITQRKRTEQLQKQTLEGLKDQLQQRTVALRHVAGRLLRSQDDEHRRIARELHDSIGQYLTALKIDLTKLAGFELNPGASTNRKRECLSDCLHLVEICLNETRTLSHLLHPPLLDEAGLISAMRWYIEGFSKRSGVQVRCSLPPSPVRLPGYLELALFRTLQESLTNVYRHSGSKTVDIRLAVESHQATLRIHDQGRGLEPELLRQFQEHGTGVGIGLAGIRERMMELEGHLSLESDTRGTIVTATLPLPAHNNNDVQVGPESGRAAAA
jgi:two-component system NarL family sensor kinase